MEKLLKNEGCNKRRSLGIFGLVFPPLISNLYYVEFSLFKKYILLFHKSMCLFNLLFLPGFYSKHSIARAFAYVFSDIHDSKSSGHFKLFIVFEVLAAMHTTTPSFGK